MVTDEHVRHTKPKNNSDHEQSFYFMEAGHRNGYRKQERSLVTTPCKWSSVVYLALKLTSRRDWGQGRHSPLKKFLLIQYEGYNIKWFDEMNFWIFFRKLLRDIHWKGTLSIENIWASQVNLNVCLLLATVRRGLTILRRSVRVNCSLKAIYKVRSSGMVFLE